MTQTIEHARHPAQRRVRHWLMTFGIIMLTAVALLWGWKTVAVDIGGLPALQFRHALAPVLAATCLAWLLKRV